MMIPFSIYAELGYDEVLRIELINGSKIYYLPTTDFIYVNDEIIEITKAIKKDKIQKIIIDADSVAVVCTMSRETYDLKLQRGELYV